MPTNVRRFAHVARDWCPPALAGAARRALRATGLRPGPDLRGRYPDWAAAVAASGGYDAPVILDRVEASVRRVLAGEAAAERDSVCFDVAPYPWPLMAALARAAARAEDGLRVLDFGGSLGGTFLMARRFMGDAAGTWRVVEQPHFVERAASMPFPPGVSLHASIADATEGFRPHVVVASGVLHYLPEPYVTLRSLASTGADTIVVDRTPCTTEAADVLTVQHIPEWIFPASYPSWLLAEDAIPNALAHDYTLAATFVTDDLLAFEDAKVTHRGWILERIRR